ncbi:54S ribosomal protein L9, mitochondrial [Sphaceloma murrayae]|uniref:Large ribosomal subunit protein uL3m n=1 Tax=Sphaceloma murrayae TaxID=2082308 RepID=A0A2K1QG05_9PEZI|nr:54S ribosomal protein L9, mitochondrial [Sphaceloma murrayae]
MPPRPCISALALPPSFLAPALDVSYTTTRSMRSVVQHARANPWNTQRNLPLLQSSKEAARQRKEHVTPLRTGALAIKKGMTAIYDPATSKRTPCTVLQLDRVQVISHKTLPKHGYWAVQVGSGTKEDRNVTRPERGHFSVNGVPLKRHVVEFQVRDAKGLTKIGTTIEANWFQEGQFVDARADCRGMGFAGGMKKHGWSGQPKSHGNSLNHRTMGSAGGSQGSGSRVIPGKAMAGRMGGQQVTVQNLRVMKVDKENGIVVVHGCVPGPKKSVVKLQDAVKKPWPEVPAILIQAATPPETSTVTAPA